MQLKGIVSHIEFFKLLESRAWKVKKEPHKENVVKFKQTKLQYDIKIISSSLKSLESLENKLSQKKQK